MAAATAYYGVEMDTAFVWSGIVTVANSTHIQISYNGNVQNYFGSGFTYSGNSVVGGTLTSSNYYLNGVKIYEVSGGPYGAATVYGYITSGDIYGLFSYAFSGADVFSGSAQADVMSGYAGNDKLYGNDGNDTLYGGDGNDLLSGGAGNDVLNGGAGDDTMLGGAGNDSYYLNTLGDKVYEATTAAGTVDAGGTDTVYSYLIHTASQSYTLTSFVEVGVIKATYTSNMTGNALNNVIYAGIGNNVIAGGSGTDTLSYAVGVSGTTGVKVNLSSTTVQATGGSGNDTISGFENLTGSSYNDSLTGNGGANVLRGGAGNDGMFGGAGNDSMYGDAGNDVLRGGTGNDVLNGGAGNDFFRFDTSLSATLNVDKISDFTPVYDTIQLENSIFTQFGTNTTGAINAGYLKTITAGGVTDSNDYIVYNKTTGALYYDSDGGADGNADAVQFALLGANLTLTNADFILI